MSVHESEDECVMCNCQCVTLQVSMRLSEYMCVCVWHCVRGSTKYSGSVRASI
jgi:hypothetical protein